MIRLVSRDRLAVARETLARLGWELVEQFA